MAEAVVNVFDDQGQLVSTEVIEVSDLEVPPLEEVFASVPVTTLEEANEVLASLQSALAHRGII